MEYKFDLQSAWLVEQTNKTIAIYKKAKGKKKSKALDRLYDLHNRSTQLLKDLQKDMDILKATLEEGEDWK